MTDARGNTIYAHWRLKVAGAVPGEYGWEGDFMAWLWKTTDRFFNEQQVWPEWAVEACCVELGIEPLGPPPHLESKSEDEAICSSFTARKDSYLASILSKRWPERDSQNGLCPTTL